MSIAQGYGNASELQAQLHDVMFERDRLRTENARLREALQFYANPEVYKPHPHGLAFDRRDLSYRAHAALGGQERA